MSSEGKVELLAYDCEGYDSVFMCKSCRVILSDSSLIRYMSRHDGMQDGLAPSLWLAATVVCGTLSENVKESDELYDKGSKFKEIVCAGCGEVVGRNYVDLEGPLKPILQENLINLRVDLLDTYMIGFKNRLEGQDTETHSFPYNDFRGLFVYIPKIHSIIDSAWLFIKDRYGISQ